jgi:hypothetical protein
MAGSDDALAKRTLELKFRLRFRLLDLLSQALNQAIPMLGAVFIVYFGIFRPIHDLAGRNTAAIFGTAIVADIRPSELVSYLFGLVGWVFGLNAQRLKRNTIERLAGRLAELEKKKDPSRTSSKLTKRGETPPEVAR